MSARARALVPRSVLSYNDPFASSVPPTAAAPPAAPHAAEAAPLQWSDPFGAPSGGLLTPAPATVLAPAPAAPAALGGFSASFSDAFAASD
eukprot:2180329-Prymnesium_polylepis.2